MCIFGVFYNYINIAVYGVFFFCLSELICNSPFATNIASLSRLPISGSYLSKFSINISGNLSRFCIEICAHHWTSLKKFHVKKNSFLPSTLCTYIKKKFFKNISIKFYRKKFFCFLFKKDDVLEPFITFR